MRPFALLLLLFSPLFSTVSIAQYGGYAGSGYEVFQDSSYPWPWRTNLTYKSAQIPKLYEMLIQGQSFNLDGVKLQGTKGPGHGYTTFDFLDCNKGSFRGATFDTMYLGYWAGVRDRVYPETIDFTHTTFKNTHLSKSVFRNWKFIRVTFESAHATETKFENTQFERCRFINSYFSKCTIDQKNKAQFLDMLFTGGGISQSTFNRVSVVDWKFFGGKITDSRFNSSVIKNVSIAKQDGTKPLVMMRTAFDNDTLINFHLDGADMTNNGAAELQHINYFRSTVLINGFWDRSSIYARFENFKWLTGQCISSNFTASVFANAVIGPRVGSRLLFRNADLSRVTFENDVRFYNCDFENCTWPADLSQARFVDCGQPPKPNENLPYPPHLNFDEEMMR